jgi:uncharacterized protein YegP (UPF0339 family)
MKYTLCLSLCLVLPCCWHPFKQHKQVCPPAHAEATQPTPAKDSTDHQPRGWKIEVFESVALPGTGTKRQTYFRCRAANGEIVFQSEGYKNHKDALKTIEGIQRNVGNAQVRELGSSK